MSGTTAEITVVANGRTYNVADGMALPEFISTLGLAPERVVVERNGEALTQAEARAVALADGDKLEIVRIVAGG